MEARFPRMKLGAPFPARSSRQLLAAASQHQRSPPSSSPSRHPPLPTCSVGTNDGHPVALLQVEVNVLEQRPSGVAVLEVLDGEHLLPHLLNLHRIRQE